MPSPSATELSSTHISHPSYTSASNTGLKMRVLTSVVLSLAAVRPPLGVPGSVQANDECYAPCAPLCDAPTESIIDGFRMEEVPGVDGCWVGKTFEDPLNVTSAIHTSRPAVVAGFGLVGDSMSKTYRGRWLRSDASQVLTYVSGAPATIVMARNDGTPSYHEVLGPRIGIEQTQQIIVPRGVWQLMIPHGRFTLYSLAGKCLFSHHALQCFQGLSSCLDSDHVNLSL